MPIWCQQQPWPSREAVDQGLAQGSYEGGVQHLEDLQRRHDAGRTDSGLIRS